MLRAAHPAGSGASPHLYPAFSGTAQALSRSEAGLPCFCESASGGQNGRRIRALDVTGKDRELLQAIADPLYAVAGITNKHLRQKLYASPWAKDGTDKQLSARLSRHLRLLRDHGLIRKMPCQRKYALTAQGRTLTTALNAMLAASTQQLMEIAV